MTGPTGGSVPAGSDPDAIKADIEATREQLGRTIDELAHRLDVPARAKESLAQATADARAVAMEGLARSRDTAVETYRESPPVVIGAGVALVGGIIGLLLWRRSRARAPRARRPGS